MLIASLVFSGPGFLNAQETQEPPLARLDNALFMSPGNSVYTEVYIRIPGKSLTYRPVDSQHFQAKTLINLKLFQKKQEPYYQKQYVIKSPKVKDTQQVSFVLTDQREVPLHSDGRYQLAFKVVDSFNQGNQATVRKPVFNRVSNTRAPMFSDIKMVDTVLPTSNETRFTEGSYLMRPMATTKIPARKSILYFYAELYNADRLSMGQEVDVNVRVLHQQDTLYLKQETFDAKPIVKVLAKLQRDKLKPGKHRVILTTPTNDKKKIATGIQITNPYATPAETTSLKEHMAQFKTDSLLTYIKWMRTIAQNEEHNQMKLLEHKPQKDSILNFITEFWKNRNPASPKEEWFDFREDVEYVNKNYSNPLYKGYESDRGRVYLQYGEPNTIQRSRQDPNTYPYEIWHYFSTKKQRNVRFVFYSTSILKSEFILLHSDAIGEINDPKWKKKLDRSSFERDDPFGNDPGWDFQK